MLVESAKNNLMYVAKMDLGSEKEKAMIVELQLQPKLKHPNILSTKETFFDNKHNFIILQEVCVYGTLSHQISLKMTQNTFKRFPEPIVRKLLVDLTNALVHVADQGIVHSDFQTKSVFLSGDGTFKLAGWTKSVMIEKEGEPMEMKREVGYCSPEVFKDRRISSKSDIWGMGVILHELCTLEHRFNHNKSYV